MAGKSGLQKAKVLAKDLPPLSVFPDGSIGHYARYRIVTQDRNKNSHWSPVYAVPVDPFPLSDTPVSISWNNETVTATWGDEFNRPRYDVLLRWGNEISAVSSNSYDRTITTTKTPNFVIGDKIDVFITSDYVNAAYFNGTHTVKSVDTVAKTITFSVEDIILDNPETPGSPTDILLDNPVVIPTESVTSDPNNHESNIAFANYYYHGTPAVHTYTFLRTGLSIIEGTSRDLSLFDIIHVDIQVESIEKTYNPDHLLVFDSPHNTGYYLSTVV